jgi:peptidoglycan/xylan/chitin deacetylase (PgdA/CDA1 family)
MIRVFVLLLFLLPLHGHLSKHRSYSSSAHMIYHGSSHHRWVTLTFDAGADRGYAARILATLQHAHIHATFGMTGRWAQANPDLVRRMVHEGDQIINHTYDHRSFTGYSTHTYPLTEQQRAWEITHADAIIRHITGHTTKPFFRPPYGDYDAATLRLAAHLGYRYVIMWTVDTLGWDGLSANQIVERVLATAQAGDIILMHVGAQSQDALALPRIIPLLEHRGYRFVTIAQMLR